MARSSRGRKRTLDDIDYAILEMIQEDCMKSAVQIKKGLKGRNLSLGSHACSNRVDSLNTAGYVVKNCAVLNPDKFGLAQLCFMLVRMRSKEKETVEKFIETAKAHVSILEVHSMTGICDYLLKVRVANMAEATRISQALSDSAADIETYAAGLTEKETTSIRVRPSS